MKTALLFAVAALLSTPAFAQEVAGFECSEFSPNADGSWTTQQPVQAQANSLGTGERILPGVYVGGIDLASRLTQGCKR